MQVSTIVSHDCHHLCKRQCKKSQMGWHKRKSSQFHPPVLLTALITRLFDGGVKGCIPATKGLSVWFSPTSKMSKLATEGIHLFIITEVHLFKIARVSLASCRCRKVGDGHLQWRWKETTTQSCGSCYLKIISTHIVLKCRQ